MHRGRHTLMTIARLDCSMKEVHSTTDLEPGMTIKTRGGDTAEVFSVRHFNDTVTIGNTRKYPLIVSLNEVAYIMEE